MLDIADCPDKTVTLTPREAAFRLRWTKYAVACKPRNVARLQRIADKWTEAQGCVAGTVLVVDRGYSVTALLRLPPAVVWTTLPRHAQVKVSRELIDRMNSLDPLRFPVYSNGEAFG